MILSFRVIKMINLNDKNFSCEKNRLYVAKNEMSAYSDMRICLIKDGTAVWNIDGIVYDVRCGDIILMNDKQKRMITKTGQEGIEYFLIKINRQAFLNTSHLSYFLELTKAKKSVIRDDVLVNILKDAEKEYSSQQDGYMEMISARITEFFILLERKIHLENVTYTKMDKNMTKVLDYIESNITEKITLSEVAGIYGMTDSAFSRHFLKVNGISFKKYIMTKKTEYAIYLLETTDKCVTDIAYECGFSSISGFYDTFKKVTGRTPSRISSVI